MGKVLLAKLERLLIKKAAVKRQYNDISKEVRFVEAQIGLEKSDSSSSSDSTSAEEAPTEPLAMAIKDKAPPPPPRLDLT
jgi:hypothetical protein